MLASQLYFESMRSSLDLIMIQPKLQVKLVLGDAKKKAACKPTCA